MILEKEVDKIFSENKNFVLASGVYIMGSLIDFISTYHGISNNLVQEINPIASESIEHFGTFFGLLIPKAALVTGIIAITKYIDYKYKQGKIKLKAEYFYYKYKQGKIKLKAEYFLYPPALLTSLTSLSWIIDNYFYK